ncbi:MAG: SCO family protein [Gaiellaceae bacterium]
MRIRRGRRMLISVVAAASLTVAVVAALALGSGSKTEPSSAGRFRGSEPPGRYELPAFELQSYRGEVLASDRLRGQVVLLTLLDSQCEQVCPLLASVIARAIDRLAPAEQAMVRALALTSDPAEDTPASVERFLSAQRAEGRLDYLLGTEAQLRPLWRQLYVLPSLDTGNDEIHSAPLRVYDRDGLWVATLHAGADLSEENLIHDIRVALRVRRDETR